ncbi:hypothetical protein [Kamptonema formosum]|uniref:hypothetical protein n=1 Tax=Kamptonema formosum TaxID=331992 RepID=UPI000376AD77|nr:hypothetical protein [Oscillatoria sp. PCC 10802]
MSSGLTALAQTAFLGLTAPNATPHAPPREILRAFHPTCWKAIFWANLQSSVFPVEIDKLFRF